MTTSIAADNLWLPTTVGDRWIYEGELRSGNRSNPEVRRWQFEQTTFRIEIPATGLLVKGKSGC